MKRFVACLGIAVFGIAAVPAAATPPAETKIVIQTVIPPEGPPTFGPFTSSGGVICPSGDTIDVLNKAAGFQSGSRLQLLVVKRFVCADGSGSFDLLFRVHLVLAVSDVATWTVVGGTGAYERLRGTGTLVGLPLPGGVLDVLTGVTHVD